MSSEGPLEAAARTRAVLEALRAELERRERALREPIAIVGLGCRFPGGRGPREFFDFLLAGGDAVREVPGDRWDASALYDPDPLAQGRAYSRWGAFLDEPAHFDAGFFGISAREAAAMDPQQRLLLEVSWEALEDAGLARQDLAGARAGVYMGICHSDHAHAHSRNLEAIDIYSATGGAFSIAANRISYLFDLRGPSMAVDTACSSSLTAVHLACQALRSAETDLAIAGGVNLLLSPVLTVNFCRVGALSRDGRCKFLDARADGYVRGEGAGVVILKTLSRAQRDGDRIYACILGSAMTQDGRSNGLMAPSGPAQEDVIRAACAQAGISPHELDYVEAHGTGTALGDVAEAHALGATVGRGRSGRPCLVGSVKANIGHLEAAAGVAGLLKVSQMLHRGRIPRQQNFAQPHPEIPLTRLGLEVPGESRAWPGALAEARAGVSSFGFGGANVHLVLGAAPHSETAAELPAARAELLVLSAHHPHALEELVATYRDRLGRADAASLASQCAAAARHRSEHRERLALVARDAQHLARLLEEVAAGVLPDGVARGGSASPAPRGPVFVFPGQGGAWWERCAELLAEPAFAEVVRSADAVLAGRLEFSLAQALQSGEGARHFADPALAQAALVTCQVAMAALLRAHGVQPVAVVGHSVGELAAAACAGALSLAEVVEVAYLRGRCMAAAKNAGGMALVALEESALRERIASGGWALDIAAVNGPESVAISGPDALLDALLGELERCGVYARRLQVPLAGHSPAVDPIVDALLRALPPLAPRRASIPFFSAIDGQLLEGSELGAPYWAMNLRRPVRFADAVRRARETGYGAFLDVGPACSLWRDTAGAAGAGADVLALPALRKDVEIREGVLRAVAALYAHGATIDWRTLYAGRGLELALPPYPWQHQVHGEPCKLPRARGPHPWLGPAQALAEPSSRWIYPGELDPRADAELQGYRVHSRPCMPASALVALLEAVALDRGLRHPLRIEELCLEPAVATDGTWELQVVVDRLERDDLRIAVYARAGEEPWLQQAACTARACADEAYDAPEPLASIAGRCTDARRPAALYAGLEERGLALPARYRGIGAARLRDGESLAELKLEAVPGGVGVRRWRAHELDACLQGIELARGTAGAPLAAFAIEQIDLHAGPCERLFGHATVVALPGALEVSADLCVRDTEQRRRAEFLGIRLRELEPWELASAPRAVRGVCALEWKPHLPRGAGGEERHQWIVIGPRSALADQIAATARERGDFHSHVDAEGLRVLAHEAAPPDVARVVLVVLPETRANGSSPAQPGDRVASASRDFLEALRVLALAPASEVRVVLVSRGAQRLPGDLHASDPVHAASLALRRVAAVEHPWLACAAVDLDPAAAPSGRDLLETLAGAGQETELALRAGRCFVPRMREQAATSPQARPVFRDDATYLISGGLGGLGLEVASWLVRRGARSLALLGRSEPSDGARRRIASLRARGVEVRVARVDVSDRSALAALLEQIQASSAPLRGIVHAAMVLESAALAEVDATALGRALAPKAAGAVHLDELTRGVELDFFILFSSLAALAGAPGLGAYSAANAWLDALAEDRAARGLPVLSIRWGRWADVGLAARRAAAGQDLSIPEPAMPPEVGIAHLEHLLGSGAQMAIAVPEALLERGSLPALLRANPLFSELPDSIGPAAREGARIDRDYVAPTSDLEARIAAIWCEVLKLERVSIRDDIWELGGDSIVGGQIIARINRSFGTALTLRRAIEVFNVAGLAAFVERETRDDGETLRSAAQVELGL